MEEKKEKVEELKTIYEEFDDEGKENAISVVEEYLSKSNQKGNVQIKTAKLTLV